MKAKGNQVNEIVVVDKKLKKVTVTYKDEVLKIINNKALDRKSRLAILAEVIDEFFDNKLEKGKTLEDKPTKGSNEVA